MLECAYGWQWYLGDRVLRQSIRAPAQAVPGPLPPLVLRTESYTLAEIERYTILDTALDQYLRPTEDYDEYRRRYLAGPLDVAGFRERARAAREAAALEAAEALAAEQAERARAEGQAGGDAGVREAAGPSVVRERGGSSAGGERERARERESE